MKTKLLFICALLFAMNQSFSQIYLFESFPYGTAGDGLLTTDAGCTAASNTNSVTGTVWNNYTGGTPCFDMTIQDEPGWNLPQIFDLGSSGNAMHWQGGGEDGELKFATEAAPVSGTGTSVYLSFLIHIRGWATTASGHTPEIYRHIGFGINDNANNGSSLFIQPGSAANTFQLGYGNSDSRDVSTNGTTDLIPDVVFSPTNYSYVDIGTDPDESNAKQFFIVIKYTFGVGGGAPDGWMWINPDASDTEANQPADLSHEADNKIRTQFISVLTQASSNNRNPDNFVDEIRVAGSWEEATNQTPLSTSDEELEASISLYPNPAKNYIAIDTKNNLKVSNIEMFNLLGQKVKAQTLSSDNTVNVSSLSKGVYLMKIYADDNSITKRVIIE